MSDLPNGDVVASAPIPPAEPEPSYGYGSRLIDARLSGHDWEDVDRFVGQGTAAAQDEGYSDYDIRDYLGLSHPDQTSARFAADAANRVSTDEQFANKLKSTAAPLAISPLESPSAERMEGYAPTAILLPETATPDPDKPLLPSGIDLADDQMRSSYARSLLRDEVRSPRDFAERYTGALGGAAGSDPGVLVRAAGELASALPSDKDFTDQAISIASSSGVALSPDSVKTVRNNLIDHWTNTGQPLEDTYKQAETDPGFAAKLTTAPQPPKSMLEQFAQADMAEVQQSADMGGWITDRLKDWYAWRMQQPDATQEGWDKAVADAKEALTTGKLSDEALNTAMGFVGGNIEGVGAKFGEAIGLLEPAILKKLGDAIDFLSPKEPMVKVLDPAAGGVAGEIPFSELFSDKTRTIVDTLSNAADRVANVAGDLKDRFFRHVGAQLGDDIRVGEPQPGTEPITVWHASPHDFDRFDISKIGTGDGNASHGVGIYFAENPEVHEAYREMFARDETTPGNSYKVALHVDPDRLLHLDKPIGEQSKTAQAAASKVAEEHGFTTAIDEATGKETLGMETTGREIYDELTQHYGGGIEGEKAASEVLQKAGFDGTKYIDELSRSTDSADTIKEKIGINENRLADPNITPASRTINEAALADYKDQLAKIENPAHNYVIFDDAKMDIREKNGNPVTPAGVQRQVENVAQGQEATQGMFGFMRNLMADESGSLNIFRTPDQAAKRGAYTDSRDYMRPLIVKIRNQGDQVMSHLYDTADHWKTVSGQMENLFKLLEPHIPEFEAELAKGINGNPMNTMIGNMIQYVEGRSMGAAMRHDSPLAPVADGIRYINEQVRGMLEDGFNRGVINTHSYFEDYFRHMWKDPNKAATAFEEFQSRVGKLGSSSGLKQRTLPTFEDGIKMGLQPAISNPLELTLFDAGQKIKYLQSAEMLKAAHDAGYVKWRMSPQGDEVALNSHRTTKGIPNDPKGRDLTAYANPGLANAWNDWLSKGFHERPGATSSLYDKTLYAFNTMNGLKLAVPMFHFMTEVAETTASGMAHSIYLLGGGHPLLAAKELALSFPGAQSVQGIVKGGDIIRQYNSRFITNPAIKALVDAGMRFGPRQEIYRSGSAPNMGVSIRRGQLINDVVGDIKRVFGDAKEPVEYRIAQAPGRALGMVAHEVGRVLNTVSAPLFDHMIPRLKAFTSVRQMDQFLKDNPLATPEQIAKRADQITRNTDERFGEMNMDNIFWPKGVKQGAQLGMISVGWVYGWARMMASAAGLNIERMAFEANPVAIRSIIGFTMAYAVENSLYQYAKTGQAPWSTDTPIKDMFAPRTGGTNQWGSPERALLPSQAKEMVDYFKVAATAAHSPMMGLQAAAEYAQAKGKTPIQFLMALATGKDAIGNDIEHTAGGWPGYIKDMLNPIFYGALNDRKKGTEISPVETMMGLHPMTKAAQDPKAFYDGLYKQDRRLYKQQIGRAKRENKIYINPREIPVDPEDDLRSGRGGSADLRAFEQYRRERGR